MISDDKIPKKEKVDDISVFTPDERKAIEDMLYDDQLEGVILTKDARMVIENFKKSLDPARPLSERIRAFLLGRSYFGEKAGLVLDLVTLFIPFGRKINTARDIIRMILGRKQKQIKKEKPMFKKILSLKNFINVKDENGRIDLQEILASVIQLVIAGAIVWGLVELGIFAQFMEFISIAE